MRGGHYLLGHSLKRPAAGNAKTRSFELATAIYLEHEPRRPELNSCHPEHAPCDPGHAPCHPELAPVTRNTLHVILNLIQDPSNPTQTPDPAIVDCLAR